VIGLLRIDKPQGVTSHDVVSRVRRVLGVRRVGHAGTLDPFASGLLLVCIGGATRLVEYIHGLDKVYDAEAVLGSTTDTDDLEGAVTARDESWRGLGEREVADALQGRSGSVFQLPPAYSAKKVAGQPAHRRLRRGETVTLAPAKVEIHEVKLLAFDPPRVRFRIRCGTGTYIRAFARDVGADLGCGGHLTGLRRTSIGPHRVEDAVPLDEISSDHLLPPEAAVGHLPRVSVTPEVAARLRQGQRVPFSCEDVPGTAADRPLALFLVGDARPEDGPEPSPSASPSPSSLLGVGSWREGILHPVKMLTGGDA
jgi:tRNA pseudouridine55 synthase